MDEKELVKKSIKELEEEGFVFFNIQRNALALTPKGREEVIKFKEKNPEMFLLILQAGFENLCELNPDIADKITETKNA